jgi:hypothetical protein
VPDSGGTIWLITRHGKAGRDSHPLFSFEDHDPRLLRADSIRSRSLRDGKGIRIEDVEA